MHEADGGTPTAIAAVLRDDTEHWQERRRLRAELTALRDGDATRPADPSVDTR